MDPGAAETPCCADFILQRDEYPIRATFNHWQLKDLACCPDGPHDVYYADCMVVKSFNVERGTTTPHLELKYPPTALTVACGYLCAVGPDSEMTVKSLLDGRIVFRGQCGSLISNSCIIRRHGPGDVRLMVSLNDARVKVYGLPAMNPIVEIPVGAQVNHCDVSPDCRLLVAVGDSNLVYVFAVDGWAYVPRKEFKAFDDCCFSCCFSPDGRHFVAAAQNGTVVLMRVQDGALHPTLTLLAFGLRTAPAAASKYCRAVKYHPTAGIDLVAFTESTAHVHLLDLWAPERRQVIRVAPDNEETDICGMCFSPDGRYLYVALQDRLVRLTVDVVGRRCRPFGELL
jgi:WD40 repeat protein